MPYNIATLFLIAGLVTGPLLIDPVHPDASAGAARAARSLLMASVNVPTTDRGAGTNAPAESAENLAMPPARSSEAGTTTATVAVEAADALATPRPTEWMSPLRRCHRRGSRRYCDGPRMVAQPMGDDLHRADDLDLGEKRTVSHLMWNAPRDAWTAAANEGAGPPTDGILFPVAEGRMGRGFGFVRRAPLRHRRHDGIDIPAAAGAAVRSVADGIVAYADNDVSGYGNLMMIVHTDGTTALYAHLRAAYLFAGQSVARGQTIGEVGSTGLSGGPHLHFEFREDGAVTDPVPRFVDLPAEIEAQIAARAERRAAARERRTRRARRARRAQRAQRARRDQRSQRTRAAHHSNVVRSAAQIES